MRGEKQKAGPMGRPICIEEKFGFRLLDGAD